MATKIKDRPQIITALEHNLTFATDADINEALTTKYRNYVYLYLYDEDNTASLQSVINEWAPYVNELYLTTQYEYNPIENYHRNEEYHGGEATTYGKKESRETDFKSEHSVDNKSAVNAGMKTEHARDETRTPNTEDITVHSDSGYDNQVGSESDRDVLTRRGTETVVSPALSNYDETTGAEADNYTRNTADPLENYDRMVGDAAKNYNQLSGKDSTAKNYTLEAYGNIGTMSTQDMIKQQRDIIINVLAFYVEKFSKCFNITPDGLYADIEVW